MTMEFTMRPTNASVVTVSFISRNTFYSHCKLRNFFLPNSRQSSSKLLASDSVLTFVCANNLPHENFLLAADEGEKN